MSNTDTFDLLKQVKSEMSAGAFAPLVDKSSVFDQQQDESISISDSSSPAYEDVLRLLKEVKQGSAETPPAVEVSKTPEETEAAAKQNLANRSEFTRGLLRGVDTTQAAFYGGLGMYSAAMGDTEAADRRFQQYQEQMRQASENPATVDQFFSTDPQKGAFGSVGNFGTWVAGTAGSLIPSVAEAAAAGVAGAAIGGAIVPAPDPGDIVTVPAGFIGGVFGRAAIKKAMAEAAQKYVEKGVAKEVADRMGRQAVNNVLAKRVGGLAAAQQITALQEGGGMYAEGREAGYDNPLSAMGLGQASGLSEVALGNMPLVVKSFLGKGRVGEAIKNADPRTAAGYIWDAVKNTGEEGVQEGFQEFLGSVNATINEPDKKLLTKENFMQWAEASAAGALAGAGFGGAGSAYSALQDRAERLKKLKEKGFISEEDAASAGIEGGNRRERMANVDAEINRIEQEMQVQDTPDPEIASMIDGMISEGESDDEFARQQAGSGQFQPPTVDQSQNQAAEPSPESAGTFMEYANAWNESVARSQGREPKPLQARTVQSLRDTIDGRADYAIKMGRSTAFVTDNSLLDALMMREIQKAVQAKGYQVDDVKRSAEGGTEYIGFNVIGSPQQQPRDGFQGTVESLEKAADNDHKNIRRVGDSVDDVLSYHGEMGIKADGSEDPYETVDPSVGVRFDAHGLSKGTPDSQARQLDSLLSNGVDSSRDFFTAPFEVDKDKKAALAAGLGTAGGTARKNGVAVVTGGYGLSIKDGGIVNVFINDAMKELKAAVEAKYGKVYNVHFLSEQKAVLESQAQSAQTPVIDLEEAARLDREYAQQMAAQQQPPVTPPPQGEIPDASAIRSPQEEVRQEEGGADLRGSGQEQVRTQPESQEPPAQAEVQVGDLPEPKSAEEVESLPKFSLYRRTAKGKKYIAVRGNGARGGGDTLHDTLEDAQRQVELDRRNAEDKQKRDEAFRRAQEQEAKAEQAAIASYQGFDADKPMQFGKSRKFLEKQLNFTGMGIMSRKAAIERLVGEGWRVVEEKGEKYLERPDGRGNYGVSDLGSTGIRYAEHVIARREREEEKPSDLPVPTGIEKISDWRKAVDESIESDPMRASSIMRRVAQRTSDDAVAQEILDRLPDGLADRSQVAWDIGSNRKLSEPVRRRAAKWHKEYGLGGNLDAVIDKNPSAKPAEQPSEKPDRNAAIRKAIEEQGGFEANSANDVDAIRRKLYNGADTPTGTEIRAVMEEMKIEAGRKAEAEASKPAEQPSAEGKTKDFRALPAKSQAKFEELWNAGGTVIAQALGINNKAYRGEFEARTGVKLPKTVKGTNEAVAKWDSEGRKLAGEAKPAAVGPVAEQPKRSEGVEAALKALDAITATEKPKAEPSPKKGRKEPEKTKLGQYVLPIMPGMAAEIDRQDFVRRYRDRALNGLLGWSRDPEDAEGIQETIDTLAPMYGDLFNRIYAGEYETVDIALDYEAYQKIEGISDTLPVGQNLILDTLMEQITAAIANFPKKPVKKPTRKSEQTLKEAKSDMQIAHDAAAALMEKIRNKLMSGVDPEISAEVVRVAYLYTKAGVKTFKGYVEAIVENFGDAFAREFSQYMQDGWEALNIRGFVQDPAGNVEDFLKGAVDEKQFYAGADGANQEGVERSDIDGKEPAGAIASEELDGVQPEDGQATEATGDTGGVRDSGADSIQQGSGRPDGNIQDVDVGGATALPGVAADGTGGGFTKPGDGAGLDLAPESTRPNFHLTNPEIIVGRGLKDKFDRNIKALELSQELEESGRPPTQEDLEVLASYIGWGAFGQELFQGNWNNPRVKKGWESENEWLREHLGEEEWRSAQESIPNAHYTDPEVVSGIWSMIEKMGFKGGRFLEPSFGIGNFAALMPRDMMSKTSFTAIELDKATARIAKILYPQINVQQKGYQDSKTPNDFYDVVATNVPFGNYKISDRMYRMPYSIHNYFFRKAIDQTKPGGLMVFVTSNMTMDGKEEAKLLRKQLSDRGDLVAAFRFPTGAFERYAKTKVVADLIIIRKRKPGEQPSPNNDDWIDVVEVDTPSGVKVSVNAYWTKNPGNILGTLDYGSGTTSGRPGMIVNKPSDLEELWREAVESVPSGIINTDRAKNEGKERPNEKKLRQNTVVHQNNELYIAKGEQLMPLKSYVSWYRANSTQATIKKIRDEMVALLNVRDSLEQVLEVQGRGDDASKQREALNKAYDSFRQKYGPISTSKSIGYLKDSGDAIGNAVASLESLTPSGEYEKRPVFTRTTVRQAPRAGEKLDIVDAFALARNDSIDVDFDEVARLARKPKSDVVEELQKADLIYKTGEDTYDAADVFLSGNIARKIRSLEAAKNEGVDGLEKSIDAAKAVLPEPLVYNQIQVGLGAPWVTAEDYSQFFADLLGEDVKNTQVMKAARGWKVNFSTSANRSPGVVTHGHSEVVFSRMVAAAMNNGRVSVFYKDSEGNSHKDETATLEANAKIDELKDKFKDWIWQTPDRIARLSHAYNEDYRSVVTPDWRNIKVPLLFEGLALQRGSDPFSLRKHQEAAVYRAIVSGKGLFAHEVGTGKTLTMASIAIESRRLRLANKPVLFAHNANSQAVYREAQEAYPGAKILYVDNLDSDNKGQAMASIATEDWDLIVIPHSLVKNLKMRPETLEKLLREQMDQLEAAALEAFEEDDSPFKGRMPTNLDDVGKEELAKLKQRTAKELVKERMRLRERIVEAQKDAANESTIFIEDMGIDMLMVDEAHIFKKIPLATRQQVKGLNKQASNIGNSLMLLSDYIRGTQNGRGVYLFTGTPITNTLNEVYNMQRFIMPEEMQAVGVKEWDGWFSTFATSETSDELSAGGTYEEFERLTSFVNLPELRASIGQYMDTVFANEMPEFVPRPTRDGRVEEGDPIIGRPYKQVHNETLDMMPIQKRMSDDLKRRYSQLMAAKGKTKYEMMKTREYNPLTINNEGVKMALDPRLMDGVDPRSVDPRDPRLKINKMIVNAMDYYNQHPKATQMIFMEIGHSDWSERVVGRDNDGKPIKERVRVYNLAKEIKRRLIEEGVAEKEIAIFSAMSKEQRSEAAKAMNRGEIRFAIGGTETLGTGVNAQENLVAMHHLDAPWMPGSLEQRNGRGHRQGNRWNTVHEHRYLTEGPQDGRRWQVLLTKDRFIYRFMHDVGDERIIDMSDVDMDEEGEGGFESTFAAAVGDPRIQQRFKLEREIQKLEQARDRHYRTIQDTLWEARNQSTQDIPRLQKDIDELSKMQKTYRDSKPQADKDGKVPEPVMTLGDVAGFPNKEIRGAESIGEALQDLFERYSVSSFATGDAKKKKVAEYRGIGIFILGKQMFAEKQYYEIKPSFSSMDGLLRNLGKRIENKNAEIEKKQAFVKSANESAKLPFVRQEQLDIKQKKLKSLVAEIEANPEGSPSWFRNIAPVGTSIYIRKRKRASGRQAVDDMQAEMFKEQMTGEPAQENVSYDIEEHAVTGYRSDTHVLYEENGESVAIEASKVLNEEGEPIYVEAKAANDEKNQAELSDNLRNLPPPLYQTAPDVNENMWSEALNLSIAAQDAGITNLRDFVAYSVKTIGRERTLQVSRFLRLAAEVAGMDGVQQAAAVSGITRDQVVTMAKRAFGRVLSDDQIEAGITLEDITAFGRNEIGFAPYGTPVPGQAMAQEDFDQPSGYKFNESDYRPAVVSYARDKWGEKIAPNGKPTWQNFVRWFGDSKVVDKDGKPLVVYHGTDKEFDVFDANYSVSPGFWFTSEESGALALGKTRPFYLSVKNPASLKDLAAARREVVSLGIEDRVEFNNAVIEKLEEAGFDGVQDERFKGVGGVGKDVWVALRPTQIKSATGNRGMFDPNNPNILMQNQQQGGSVKGWTKFISAHRALIGATNKADFSTFIHEFFHPMRLFLLDKSVPAEKRADITDEEIEALEKASGAGSFVNGKWVTKWDVKAEEKAAKMWEQYWYEGDSPNSVLDSLFQKISRWMREIYSGVQEITGTPLPKEIRDLFDKLVQRGLPADQRGGKGGEPVSRGEPVLRPANPVTSIQNEVANYMALLRGSPGLVDAESETMDEWLEEAGHRLRQDPTLGDRLVKELDDKLRSPDQIEVAVLQMHYRGLENAREAAEDRLFAAKDRKDSVAAAKALREVDLIVDAMEEMEKVDKKIGTLQARAFGARKITLRSDFSRAALLRRGRAANGGERLSAEQTRQIAELAAELAKVQGDLAKAEQVIADLQRQDGVRQVVDDDLKKAPKTKTKSEPRQKAATAVQSFVKKFSSIFKPKGGSDTLMQTEDERMAEEAESVVMAYVEAGVFSYGELLANLRKEIGGELPVQAQAAFATAWEKIKAQGEIPIPMVSPGDVEGLTRIAREIEMAIIESGIVTADQEDRVEVVLDAVWRSLQEIDPEITERQTMDALTGYGQFTPLSPDANKRLQRDINGQLLQMAKIKDLEAGIRPKATGVERREMSDDERALVRQVNEMKRNSNLYTEDEQGLLKTSIGAAMRATANRIRDLRKAMAEGKPITKTQVDLASKDKDLAEQKRILAEVTKDYREMFPRQGATKEQRLAAALRATDREIERVTEQLRTGDFSPRGRAEPVTSAELKAKQAELESLRAQRDAIKAQQNPKMSPQERAEVAYIANLKNRIADYEDRMAHGYFGAKPKKAPLESDEITKHKRRLEEIKEEFFRLAAEWRLSQLSPKERVFDWARETSFLARAIMTSMDLSAVFRQGGPGTFAHPMLAREAAKEMRRAIFSQEEEFNIAEQMSKHRLYSFAVQAKLEVTASAGRIQNQEEAYMGRWARDGIGKKGTKINKFSKAVLTPVAMSARAYTTYLNGLRFRLFTYFVDTLGANGQVTLDEAKAIANFINVSTGRGDFGSYNKVAANLSTVLFAPRYLASRFAYLGLPFYMLQDAKVSGRVKRLIAMEYARHALGVAGFLATAVALGGLLYDDDDEESPTVELDPRSTDFMKLKIGETRIDPLSGFGQIVTFLSQVGLGQKKTMEGEIIDIRGEKKKYGQDSTFDLTANFIRKKLAPIPAAGINIIAGEDVVGNKATVATATTGLFIPLAGREVVETLMARGVPEGPAIAMLNILGMSGGTYGPKTKYKNANAEERKKLIEKDLEAMEWDSKDPGYKDFLTKDELERFKQRREQRKQSLVYSASANPKRKDFQDDTTYAKAVAERDKALKTMIDGKIGPEEARLLLLAYWRRNNKTLYERKGQALVMKDALVERLRQITQKLNQK
jgi:N12 class adenine-specific DNA methylase